MKKIIRAAYNNGEVVTAGSGLSMKNCEGLLAEKNSVFSYTNSDQQG